MVDDDIEIERVVRPSAEHVRGLARLVPQLSGATPPTLEALGGIVANPGTFLYVARSESEIVGCLSLITFAIPTGVRAWIEDVVVDEAARGRGIASGLVRHAIEQARAIGALSIDLTSRPSRTEANRLYQRLGFSQRETNVYRFPLE